MLDTERAQRDHYDRIAAEYDAHSAGELNSAYRQRFLYEPMFRGAELAGARVLEAMCGGGQMVDYLLSRGASVVGLDLSSRQVEIFRRRWPGCEAFCASILDTGLESESFDCVVVAGALHHLHPHVEDALAEIHRVLKPGGSFCFYEPHAGSLPDVIRKWWYRRDDLFEAHEAAVDLAGMKRACASRFAFHTEIYGGNVAYLLIMNSLVFRVPLWLKRLYGPLLLPLEALLGRVQGKLLSCMVVCQWRKLGASARLVEGTP